jgi:hypothetical protein
LAKGELRKKERVSKKKKRKRRRRRRRRLHYLGLWEHIGKIYKEHGWAGEP